MNVSAIFPDNSVAIDFAIVGKTPLLVEWLRGRGAVCDAVLLELEDWTASLPEIRELIDVLGTTIELSKQEGDAAEQVRLNVLGGTTLKPREHLGEARTLHVIRERPELRGSTWLSDDADSRELAGLWSIRTMTSVDVLCELMAEKGASFYPDAFDIWTRMFDHPNGGCERPTSTSDMKRRAGL